ncbi:NAD(P)/FAD-dependent oxidoreductase [uncultured Ilyobacter sp.]|uniref:NAD(P)/FAD-dependent oxidoreductase n=1 Tax=uncultured Ilyobacter sp. TaxID=544433 RepID=UPI002AA60B64|nr:NAD(P)/FAD-dependent oxidoreductase [uncultured Ilyobacter sp.]
MNNWKLLEPTKIGNKTLRNRIVLPPIETRLSNPDGTASEIMAQHYGRRAKGGVGMVVVESTFVDDKASRSSFASSKLSTGNHIASKYLVANAIKEAGAVAVIQINHGGRQANPEAAGGQPVAPSNVGYAGNEPHVLTKSEIIEIEDAFAAAAERAKLAGFDGVEIHGAHGYLILSFLSPFTNKREDEYGGSVEKRRTFPTNIINKIRKRVGEDFIVGYRISGAEFVEDGLTIEDTSAFVKSVQDKIDYIHVSAGVYESMAFHMISPLYVNRAPIVHLAAKMKEVVDIPVIAVGSLGPKEGEQALQKGEADLISFGRPLLADPDLPRKLSENRLEDIKPCVRGNEGCISLFFKGCPIRCEVNPQVGRDKEYEVVKTNDPRNIVVIGGGIAGMEAARLADEMGHKVTLFEKTNEFGGRFLEATEPSFKTEGRGVVNWAKTQLEKSTVDIRMNTEASPEMIKDIKPDAVIIATGSDYIKLPIKGIEKAVSADKVLLDPSLAGEKTAIIGGGLIGSETSLYLAEKGKKTGIFEMREDIAMEDEPLSQITLKTRLTENSVDIHLNAKVVEILDDGIIFSQNGKEQKYVADKVVFATGLATIPNKQFENLAPQIFKIGDAVQGRKIFECFHEAWYAVRNIK